MPSPRRNETMKQTSFLLGALITVALSAVVSRGADVKELAATVNAIGLDGSGYPEAVVAVESLSKLESDAVLEILGSFDDDNPIAANWLRGAVESVAENARKQDKTLADEKLVAFIQDTSHSPKARAVAYHLLGIQNRSMADDLIPGFENDPSLELRLLAVDHLIGQAKTLNEADQQGPAIETYRKALTATRNAGQAQQIADALKELGEEVDTTEHFGFVKNWHIIAPFDFAGGEGFEKKYPPEIEINLKARYPGKLVEELDGGARWKPIELGESKSRVDFNKAFAPIKEVVGYAVTTFDSDEARAVELRWGSPNGTKVWINGDLVGANKVYHAGDNFDQYIAKVDIKPGENIILVKLVQNDQTQSWTNVWHFSLRVCDHLGTAIHDAKP